MTIEKLNAVIDYIEDHIEESLSIERIAKHGCVSSFELQRMFSTISKISIAEYIRKRKLTLAGKELQGSNAKVIDIALKYGYDSPTSFARAFKSFHNVSPQKAKDPEVKLNEFLRLVFMIAVFEVYDPIKCEVLTLQGKEYKAYYYGEQNIEKWSEKYCKRKFWRLERAYDDLKDMPKSGDILPYNNYPPINIKLGQAFVLDYYLKDSSDIVRRYYISDGTVWQSLPCTSEVIIRETEYK